MSDAALIRDNDKHRAAAARFKAAKAQFSTAAALALHGDRDAALRATEALAEVNAARADLERCSA